MTRRGLALLGLLGLAAPALAFFEGARRQLLSPASAGRGGVEAAADASMEGLLDNPAALPIGASHELLGVTGTLDQGALHGLGLARGLAPGLRAGLYAEVLQDQRLSPVFEHRGALALSLDPAQRMSIGLRANALRMEGAGGVGVSGASLDLGWRWQPKPPLLPGAWTLGAAADHVAGAWPDEDWARAAPSDLRAGLAWRPWNALWLGVEQRWDSRAGTASGGERGARYGVEWNGFGGGWALRGGWREEQGGQWTAGLGLPLFGFAHSDLAILSSSGSSRTDLRFSLRHAFGAARERLLSVRPSLVLTDPATGRVERATFRLGVDPSLSLLSWRLELRDDRGRLRRTLGPFGAAESAADWDGNDDDGRPVEEGHRMGYTAVAQTDKGELRASSLLALAQAWDQAAAPAAGGVEAPRLRPVLGADGTALQEVSMELPDVEAAGWHLRLRDSRGKVQREFSGLGKPPRELVWDGRDQAGELSGDPLGVSVEFQVRGEDGSLSSADQPLFNQQAFELAQQEAKAKPRLNLAPLGLPLSGGALDLAPLDTALGPLLASAALSQGGLAESLRNKGVQALRKSAIEVLPDGAQVLDLYDPSQTAPRADRAFLLSELPAGAGLLQLQGRAVPGEAFDGDAAALGRKRAFEAALRLQARATQGQSLMLEEGLAAERSGLVVRISGLTQRAPGWEDWSFARRSEALARSAPRSIHARYNIAEDTGHPDELKDLPLGPERLRSLSKRWGLPSSGLLTQWNAKTGKVLLFAQGWLWITDAQGSALRSLWHEADLNAAGRLRWSEDGTRIWLRADGWRRWVCLDLEMEQN